MIDIEMKNNYKMVNINFFRGTSFLYDWFWICITSVATIINLLPYAKYAISYVVAGSFLLLVLLLLFLQYGKLRYRMIKIGMAALIPALVMVCVTYPGVFKEGINELIALLRIFVPAILLKYLIYNVKRSRIKVFFMCFTAVIVFIMIKTIYAIETNPMIVRMLAGGSTDDMLMAYRYDNVGGFGFAYGIVFIIPLMLKIAMSSKKIIHKILSYLICFICLLFIIRTQYFTALLLSFFCIVMIIYTNAKTAISKAICVMVSIGILSLVKPICQYLYNSIDLEMLSYKIGILLRYLEGNGISSLGKRPQYILESIIRFLNSPIWGNTRVEGVTTYFELTNHSTIASYLELTGLLGISAFIYVLNQTRKTIKEALICVNGVEYMTVPFMGYFMLLILNPMVYAYDTYYILLLYIPLGIYLFKTHRQSRRL